MQSLWKTVWWSLTKLNLLPPHGPAITFLGIYPEESKTCVYTDTCAQKLIAALFINAKAWKQPRYPLADEWTNKLIHPDNGIFIQCWKEVSRQAIKRYEGNLNAYYLVKVLNLKRLHTIWFQLYGILERAKLWRQQKDRCLPGVWEEWGINWWSIGDFYDNGIILYDTIMVDICHYICICQNPLKIQHQDWTISWTTQCGWWCVKVSSSVVMSVLPQWGCW